MRYSHFPGALAAACLCLLAPITVLAQATPPGSPLPSPPRGPNSVVPSDSNYKEHYNWNKECEDRIAAMKGKPCDLIFIGDSITQNFIEPSTPAWTSVGKPVWDRYYASRHALDFGVGADATQHVLWRLDHMDIKAFKPKVAVILVGVNNHQDSVPDVAAGIKAIIAKTQSLFAGVKIILVSILPNGHSTQPYSFDTQKGFDVNKIIQTFADGRSVYYLDLASKMTPLGNNWRGIGSDNLHVTPAGYELWASTMEPLLKPLLASPF